MTPQNISSASSAITSSPRILRIIISSFPCWAAFNKVPCTWVGRSCDVTLSPLHLACWQIRHRDQFVKIRDFLVWRPDDGPAMSSPVKLHSMRKISGTCIACVACFVPFHITNSQQVLIYFRLDSLWYFIISNVKLQWTLKWNIEMPFAACVPLCLWHFIHLLRLLDLLFSFSPSFIPGLLLLLLSMLNL